MSKINIELDLNNEYLEQVIKDEATKAIVREFVERAKKIIYQSHYSPIYESNNDLSDLVKNILKDIIQENIDEIIEKAASNLAASMARSKNIREKYGELLDQKMEEEK